MKITTVKIDSIKPYGKNPRKNDGAVDAVAESIKEFGFRQPIVVDADNVIVCGHTRWKAAKKLGMKEVPVHVAADLTPDQCKAYRIADNSTRDLSSWDDQLLLEEITGIDIDMGKFGVMLTIGEDYDIEEDDFDAEPPEEAVTQRGDIYVMGDHVLMCGDSTRKEDVAELFEHGRKIPARMIFTDPPWNVDYGADSEKWKDKPIKNDNMSTEEFTEFLSKAFDLNDNVLTPGAIVYVVIGGGATGSALFSGR